MGKGDFVVRLAANAINFLQSSKALKEEKLSPNNSKTKPTLSRANTDWRENANNNSLAMAKAQLAFKRPDQNNNAEVFSPEAAEKTARGIQREYEKSLKPLKKGEKREPYVQKSIAILEGASGMSDASYYTSLENFSIAYINLFNEGNQDSTLLSTDAYPMLQALGYSEQEAQALVPVLRNAKGSITEKELTAFLSLINRDNLENQITREERANGLKITKQDLQNEIDRLYSPEDISAPSPPPSSPVDNSVDQTPRKERPRTFNASSQDFIDKTEDAANTAENLKRNIIITNNTDSATYQKDLKAFSAGLINYYKETEEYQLKDREKLEDYAGLSRAAADNLLGRMGFTKEDATSLFNLFSTKKETNAETRLPEDRLTAMLALMDGGTETPDGTITPAEKENLLGLLKNPKKSEIIEDKLKELADQKRPRIVDEKTLPTDEIKSKTETPKVTSYKIKPGDTLFKIARKLKTDNKLEASEQEIMKALKEANPTKIKARGSDDYGLIRAGDELSIPEKLGKLETEKPLNDNKPTNNNTPNNNLPNKQPIKSKTKPVKAPIDGAGKDSYNELIETIDGDNSYNNIARSIRELVKRAKDSGSSYLESGKAVTTLKSKLEGFNTTALNQLMTYYGNGDYAKGKELLEKDLNTISPNTFSKLTTTEADLSVSYLAQSIYSPVDGNQTSTDLAFYLEKLYSKLSKKGEDNTLTDAELDKLTKFAKTLKFSQIKDLMRYYPKLIENFKSIPQLQRIGAIMEKEIAPTQ